MKILTEGKVVPSEGVVQQFYRWLTNILSKIRKHVLFTIIALEDIEIILISGLSREQKMDKLVCIAPMVSTGRDTSSAGLFVQCQKI